MSGGERDPSPPFGNSYHGRKNSDGQHWRAIAHSHQMWSLRIRETTQESGRHMTGIAPDVRLSEPLDDGQRWILENAHGEKIGVSADVATFITAMQDSTDLYEVNRRFGKDNVRKVIDSSIRIPCVPQRGTETGTQGCACLFPKRQTDGGIPRIHTIHLTAQSVTHFHPHSLVSHGVRHGKLSPTSSP